MTAFFVFTALSILSSFIYILSRRVDVGLISLLTLEAYNQTFGLSGGMIGPVHLSPADVVSFCLVAAGIIRTARTLKHMNATFFVAMGYIALLGISLLRGLYANGIFTTLNEFRSFAPSIFGALYFLTAPTDERAIRRYTVIYLYFGAALCVVAVLAAIGLPVGVIAWAHSDAAGADGRYLPATGALAIAVCGFLSLALAPYRNGGLMRRLLPVVYMSVAIYLRHRTVWMVMLAGTVGLLLLDRRLFRRLLPATLGAIVVIACLVIYGASTTRVPDLNQFADSATNEDTWIWRMNGWKELLLDEEQNPLTVAIGKSIGSGYWRIDPDLHSVVDVAPHSEYVQEYLRVGIVGTLLLVLFLIRPVVGLWKMTKINPWAVYPSTSAWAIVGLITVVYGITYSIEVHTFALAGIANAIILGLKGKISSTVPEQSQTWEIAADRV